MRSIAMFLFLCYVSGLTAHSPLIIGIAGGTGSGKTTLAKKLKSKAENKVILIEQDCYYKDLSHLTHEEKTLTNFDHPDSIDFQKLCEDIEALKKGESIDQPQYNFKEHSRDPDTTHVEPRDVIIVEGILILNNPILRNLLDLKIYVDTDDDVRILRRIIRDIEERGRTLESVKSQYLATVKPMHNEFVESSKRFADVVIPGDSDSNAMIDLICEKFNKPRNGSSR